MNVFLYWPLLISALLCIPVHGNAEDSVGNLKVDQNIRRTGTKWLFYGEGYLTASRFAVLERFVYVKKENRLVNTKYAVKDPDGLASLRRWLAKNISPLLNTDRRDNAMKAVIVPWALSIFASDKDQEDARLLYLPLADIFPSFSEEAFQSLIKEWRAVEVKD